MTKLCECGCGMPVAPNKRFIVYHHLKGKTNPRYKGGVYYSSFHKRWIIICRDGSRVQYARAIMESVLKRKLSSEEIVHHINGNSTDDSPENLTIMTAHAHNLVSCTKYTRDQLLNIMKEYYLQTGRNPKYKDFLINQMYPHPCTYKRIFGFWNNALKAAGLPINKHDRRGRGVQLSG